VTKVIIQDAIWEVIEFRSILLEEKIIMIIIITTTTTTTSSITTKGDTVIDDVTVDNDDDETSASTCDRAAKRSRIESSVVQEVAQSKPAKNAFTGTGIF